MMLCLYEVVDHVTMENSVHWHGDMLGREEGHVL